MLPFSNIANLYEDASKKHAPVICFTLEGHPKVHKLRADVRGGREEGTAKRGVLLLIGGRRRTQFASDHALWLEFLLARTVQRRAPGAAASLAAAPARGSSAAVSSSADPAAADPAADPAAAATTQAVEAEEDVEGLADYALSMRAAGRRRQSAAVDDFSSIE